VHCVDNAATALGVAKSILRREWGEAIWQGQVRGLLITRCKSAVPRRWKAAEGRRTHTKDPLRARRTNEAQWRASEWYGRFEGPGGAPPAASTAGLPGLRYHRSPSARRNTT
jgi:hypothetical protein